MAVPELRFLNFQTPPRRLSFAFPAEYPLLTIGTFHPGLLDTRKL
jgi:hypothetical protein